MRSHAAGRNTTRNCSVSSNSGKSNGDWTTGHRLTERRGGVGARTRNKRTTVSSRRQTTTPGQEHVSHERGPTVVRTRARGVSLKDKYQHPALPPNAAAHNKRNSTNISRSHMPHRCKRDGKGVAPDRATCWSFTRKRNRGTLTGNG